MTICPSDVFHSDTPHAMPRQAICTCGTCRKCTARIAAREAYQSKTPEERRALIQRRDPERVRAADRARYARDREKRLEAMKAYAQTGEGRAVRRRATRAYRERHSLKFAAHQAVASALRKGVLQRESCERANADCCGRICAHHDDYSKPLEVRWLCDHHHKQHHLSMA